MKLSEETFGKLTVRKLESLINRHLDTLKQQRAGQEATALHFLSAYIAWKSLKKGDRLKLIDYFPTLKSVQHKYSPVEPEQKPLPDEISADELNSLRRRLKGRGNVVLRQTSKTQEGP